VTEAKAVPNIVFTHADINAIVSQLMQTEADFIVTPCNLGG